MTVNKPIKRSRELVPLSREHHDGLLLCWKIKTGISNGTELNRITRYVLHFYNNYLEQHFSTEEEYVFTILDKNNPFRIQAETHHRELRTLINDLKKVPGNDISVLNNFSKLLDEHIRFEERELFPLIEQTADPVLLKKASEEINCHPGKNEVTWGDIFWAKIS